MTSEAAREGDAGRAGGAGPAVAGLQAGWWLEDAVPGTTLQIGRAHV